MIDAENKTVTLEEMLAARDRRAFRQSELLERYRLPIVSFTMNIAGPVKNSRIIRRGFAEGKRLLLEQLLRMHKKPVYFEECDENTGCEGLYVIDLDASVLKKLTCVIEDQTALGRLFDMDVIDADGTKLDRTDPRRCIICSGAAKECARSRRHSVEELQAATRRLLDEAINTIDSEYAACIAVRSLLYEVCVTPKPGLVDRNNNGSHSDMDIYTFMNSASSLWPYFKSCAAIGMASAAGPAEKTFELLRAKGIVAEGTMFAATGGVNTHKGAVFSVGLVCGALGRLPREKWTDPEAVLNEISLMTKDTIEAEFAGITEETAATNGERFYVRYGMTGVRGQAAEGFPAVLKTGLPALEKGLELGLGNDISGSAAMLAMLADTGDTNMVARGGAELQRSTAQSIKEILDRSPFPDKETLEELDRSFIDQDLSPGGSADLMALCWMLHLLKESGSVI